MSRGAYENYFRQPAPEGAFFGVDMSWFQATANGDSVDYETCRGYWLDVHTWAAFVNIRSSYGANGDDGAQWLHWQIADELGYTGNRGMYHFIHAERGVMANFNNFMNRTEPFKDQLGHYMGDYEASPNAGAGFINEFCDRVEQARQKPFFNYGGKYYLDAAGLLTCPAKKLWIAHYPPRSADAWNPYSAPNMPDQFEGLLPGVWQWQSLTPEHGHLDLNISTTPEMFGGSVIGPGGPGEDDDMGGYLSQQQVFDMANRIEVLYNEQNGRDFNALGLLRDVFNMSTWNEQRAPEVMELLRKITELPDATTAAVVKALGPVSGGAGTPVDYDRVKKIVEDALNKLVLKSS